MYVYNNKYNNKNLVIGDQKNYPVHHSKIRVTYTLPLNIIELSITIGTM